MAQQESSFFTILKITCYGLALSLSTTTLHALDCPYRLPQDTDDSVANRLVNEANLIFEGRLNKVEFFGRPEGDFHLWILTYGADRVHKGIQKGYHWPPISIRILAEFYCDSCEKLSSPRILKLPEWSLMRHELVLAGKVSEGLEKYFPLSSKCLKDIAGSIGDCRPSRFAPGGPEFGRDPYEAMAIYKVLREMSKAAE